jgi:hypothetical protein
MAIKVQGTTVIDNSRNLQNIINVNSTGNAYANSFIGDGSLLSNLPASGGSYAAEAAGAIANGDVVVVNANGTLSAAATSVSRSITSPAGWSGTDTPYSSHWKAVYDPNSNRIVIIYSHSAVTKVKVGTISSGSISFGSAVTLESNWMFQEPDMVFDPDTNQILIVYATSEAGKTNYPKVVTGSVSGSSITFGTPVVVYSGAGNSVSIGYDTINNKFVIFRYNSGSSRPEAVVGTVSGTSISLGTAKSLNIDGLSFFGDGSYNTVFDPSSGVTLGAYVSSSRFHFTPGKVNGTDFDVGSHTVVYGDGNYGSDDFRAIYIEDHQAIFVVADNDAFMLKTRAEEYNDSETNGMVSEIGPITEIFAQNTVSDTSIRSIAYDTVSKKVIVAVTDSSTNKSYVISVKILGDLSLVADDPILVQSPNAQYPGCVYDPDTDQTFVGFIDTGGSSYGEYILYTAERGNLTTENFLGFSAGTYTNGSTATVNVIGSVNELQTGLSAGQRYFVAANGALSNTSTSPYPFAGTALSSTKILVKG